MGIIVKCYVQQDPISSAKDPYILIESTGNPHKIELSICNDEDKPIAKVKVNPDDLIIAVRNACNIKVLSAW